jgi:hypothetical protein
VIRVVSRHICSTEGLLHYQNQHAQRASHLCVYTLQEQLHSPSATNSHWPLRLDRSLAGTLQRPPTWRATRTHCCGQDGYSWSLHLTWLSCQQTGMSLANYMSRKVCFLGLKGLPCACNGRGDACRSSTAYCTARLAVSSSTVKQKMPPSRTTSVARGVRLIRPDIWAPDSPKKWCLFAATGREWELCWATFIRHACMTSTWCEAAPVLG